ncbi:spindle assembly abnormal protein 6 homolog [Ctenocephalides felis]|uniref:spindle assembly abnormal protein 6 homolog n=1 Tax=Ctenocephalides felis TaxID=7515 RepID=UPI000E6E45F4|nr:spindle assembly abnormal protein 6 homolog [Ctenocephalides felis]
MSQSEPDTCLELDDDVDHGESVSDIEADIDIEFIKKKIEELREQTISRKLLTSKAKNDEENFAKDLQDLENTGASNIRKLEQLRNELNKQRSANVVLEEHLNRSLRELHKMQTEADTGSKRLHTERKKSSEQANKVQKDLDNLICVIDDLPARFSRERLQAEVSAIREQAVKMDGELSLMRNELEYLKNKLVEYPTFDEELDISNKIAEDVIKDFEESERQVIILRKEEKKLRAQILQAEATSSQVARDQISNFFEPNLRIFNTPSFLNNDKL